MRFSVAVLLTALVLAAFLSRSSEKEGFWSKAKGYIAMAGSRFPGETIGTGFGGTTAAAAACTAQSRCAGFMIKRGKKTKGAERPYWLVDASVLTGANRQKNSAWTTYMTKAHRDALKISTSPGYNQAAVQSASTPAPAPAPAPASNTFSTYIEPKCNGQFITMWDDVERGAGRPVGKGKGSSKSYPCGDYPDLGEWNDKIAGIEVPPGLKVDVYEGKNFEKWLETIRSEYNAPRSKWPIGEVIVSDLKYRNGGMADKISSFKVAADV